MTATFGPYELLGELGRGGMGVVYRARHRELHREVALKVMTAGPHATADDVARFMREARTAAKLEHPGIIPVFDVGEHGGQAYYTMTLVRGLTLAELIRQMKCLPPRTALKIARDAALALHHAHTHHVVHRDVKPANIMLAYDEPDARTPERDLADSTLNVPGRGRTSFRVMVADFGCAKVVDAGATKLTVSGMIVGTPAYMSPEQAMGELRRVGPRSDVYSLGAVLYEMVAGRTPFEMASTMDLIKVIAEDPPPPKQFVPALHDDVQTLILKAMEKDPERRYATAKDLADDIARYLDGEAISARPRSAAFRAWRWIARRRAVAVPVFAAAAALIAVGAWLWTRPGTLRIRVTPHDARVYVDDRPCPAGDVRVSAGLHRVRAERADYEPAAWRDLVGRNATVDVALELTRQTGRLTIETEPPGEVLIGGRHHGTPLLDHELPTGRHTLWVERRGGWRRRLELDVRAGETRLEWVSLPQAVRWSFREADWTILEPAGDFDGDGVVDFAGLHYGYIIHVVSGGTGEVRHRWQQSMQTNTPALVVDVDGNGVCEVVTCVNAGSAFALAAIDIRTGRRAWTSETLPLFDYESFLPGAAGKRAVIATTLDLDGDGLRDWIGLTREPALVALSSRDGRRLWHSPLPKPVFAPYVEVRERAMELTVGRDDWLRVVDAQTGAVLRDTQVKTPAGGTTTQCDRYVLRHIDGRLECWDAPENRTLWSRPCDITSASWAEHPPFRQPVAGRPPELYVRNPDGRRLTALTLATGSERWSIPVETTASLLDLSVDGRPMLAVRAGHRVSLLDPDTGRESWTFEAESPVHAVIADDRQFAVGTAGGYLHLLDAGGRWIAGARLDRPAFSAHAVDLDRDGIRDFVVQSQGGMTALHGPKVLWTREMSNAIRAEPMLYDVNGDGTSDVILPVTPAVREEVCAFDGRTGALLWSHPGIHMIRRVGLANLAGDAMPEVLAWTGGPPAQIRALDARTGHTSGTLEVPTFGYAEPAVADLDGDGVPDIVALGWWNDGRSAAISGRTREPLWETTAGACVPAGASIHDVNRDGKPDVVFGVRGGRVAAHDGPTGRLLWERRLPATVEGLVTVAPPAVLVNCADGRIYSFDAATGEPRGSVAGGGTPSQPVLFDGTIIVGHVGLICLDPSGRLRWRAGDAQVDSDPVLADLDGDGAIEVIAGTKKGSVLCVDARTGELRWEWKSPDGAEMPAAAAVADMDGDRVLDVVVGSASGRLTCLSGRGRIRR